MSISTGDKELEFADPKEEAKYWKQFAEDLERKWVVKGPCSFLLVVLLKNGRMKF